jgi:hypothetical protein
MIIVAVSQTNISHPDMLAQLLMRRFAFKMMNDQISTQNTRVLAAINFDPGRSIITDFKNPILRPRTPRE